MAVFFLKSPVSLLLSIGLFLSTKTPVFPVEPPTSHNCQLFPCGKGSFSLLTWRFKKPPRNKRDSQQQLTKLTGPGAGEGHEIDASCTAGQGSGRNFPMQNWPKTRAVVDLQRKWRMKVWQPPGRAQRRRGL